MMKSLRQDAVKIWKIQKILNVSEIVLQKIRKRKNKPQTTNYWLAKDEAESLNSNRFSILDTNVDNDIDNEPETKIQKPPPIFVDGVSNIQPLYEMLNNSAKNSYDIKIVSSNQVKIQLKTPETFFFITVFRCPMSRSGSRKLRRRRKELEAKQTQFHTYKPKQERVILRHIHPSVDITDLKEELKQNGH